jgi:hypothetical protein
MHLPTRWAAAAAADHVRVVRLTSTMIRRPSPVRMFVPLWSEPTLILRAGGANAKRILSSVAQPLQPTSSQLLCLRTAVYDNDGSSAKLSCCFSSCWCCCSRSISRCCLSVVVASRLECNCSQMLLHLLSYLAPARPLLAVQT